MSWVPWKAILTSREMDDQLQRQGSRVNGGSMSVVVGWVFHEPGFLRSLSLHLLDWGLGSINEVMLDFNDTVCAGKCLSTSLGLGHISQAY